MGMLYDYRGNLHLHSIYSDGHAPDAMIALAALRAGLDFIFLTDHNVWVPALEGYRYLGERRLLFLCGEEVHDQARQPQKNHLLVYEAQKELAPLAYEPQRLINAARQEGGLTFLAHPTDPSAPRFDEDDLSWVSWGAQGFTGMEIWNFMSEFKSRLSSLAAALYYVYNPRDIARAPFPQTMAHWDRLLAAGHKMVAIGGADAHGTPASLGPLRRTVFPYSFLFRAINTHILTREALSGDLAADRLLVADSLRNGRCWVGNDLAAPTDGFRFSAYADRGEALIGEEISLRMGVTLQIHLPRPARLRLIHNGRLVQAWDWVEAAVLTTTETGAYRVEAHLPYRGRLRGWIYSNPIYVIQ